jgi:hypothetical protein
MRHSDWCQPGARSGLHTTGGGPVAQCRLGTLRVRSGLWMRAQAEAAMNRRAPPASHSTFGAEPMCASRTPPGWPPAVPSLSRSLAGCVGQWPSTSALGEPRRALGPPACMPWLPATTLPARHVRAGGRGAAASADEDADWGPAPVADPGDERRGLAVGAPTHAGEGPGWLAGGWEAT